MIGQVFLITGSVVIFATGLYDYGRSKGYLGPSMEDFRLDLERDQDFSKEDLPAVGSGGGRNRIVGIGYITGFTIQLIGSLLYFGVI